MFEMCLASGPNPPLRLAITWSFTAFKDVFDHVIAKRNGGFGPDAKHISNMDPSQLSQTEIDPTGKYVLTTRCRTGRSVRGFKLPPATEFQERRDLEALIVKALNQMDGELKGKYYGLCGSQSTDSAMDKDKEERLRKSGNLFQEPDSTLLLSSGCGRHWPDAREIFTRFANACAAMEKVFHQAGKAFMHNDHLGYVLTCPSNLGTGLRAGAMVKA